MGLDYKKLGLKRLQEEKDLISSFKTLTEVDRQKAIKLIEEIYNIIQKRKRKREKENENLKPDAKPIPVSRFKKYK